MAQQPQRAPDGAPVHYERHCPEQTMLNRLVQQHAASCGGGELKIIAAILERPVIEKILTHLGLDPQPPPRGRAREVVQD